MLTPLKISCPHCEESIELQGTLNSRQVRCPQCQRPISVSTATAAAGMNASLSDAGLSETTNLANTKSSASSQTASQVGRLSGEFGHYQIVKKLGEGAMGAVYLAVDPKLDRKVAIKVPILDGDNHAAVLERFRHEARAVATLQHANICPIFEVSEVDGLQYMAMAYIDGAPMSAYVRADKPQPIKSVVKLVRKLALAMQRAHEAGVIHRDLKPDNVMISKRGEPLIMDFGLARREGKNEETRLTRAGQLVGTPVYMSPEQVAGKTDAIGPGCDIWSLGVILYELLTGQLPLLGDNLSAMIAAVVLEKPSPPSKHRAEIDPALDAICLKAMEKKIEDRYQSMGEFAKVLTDYLLGRGSVAVTESTASQEQLTDLTQDDLFGDLGSFEQQVPIMSSASTLAAPSMVNTWGQPRRAAPNAFRNGKLWAIIGAAGGVLLLVVVLLGVILSLKTDYGTLEVEAADGENVQVAVLRNGEEVNVIDQSGDWSLRIAEGDYQLALKGGDDRFVLDQQSVTVSSGDKVKVRVTIKPASKPAKNATASGAATIAAAAGPGGRKAEDIVAEQSTATSVPTPMLPPTDSQNWIDLIELVELSRHQIAGNWQRKGHALISDDLPFSRILLPFTLPANYRLRAKVTRLSGSDSFFVKIDVGRAQCRVVLYGWGGTHCGMQLVNGQGLPYGNPTNARLDCKIGEDRVLDIEVTSDGDKGTVSADIDGVKLFRWAGKQSELSLLGLPSPSPAIRERLPSDRTLVIGSNVSRFQISELRLANIEGGKLSPSSAGVPDRQGESLFVSGGQEPTNAQSMGVALADLDGDGDLDAFVANMGQPNTVWLNDGHARFSLTNQPLDSNDPSRSVALGDLDGDGDIDAFVTNLESSSRVWLNDGRGRFNDNGQQLGKAHSNFVALGDLDRDGDLDAFVANGSAEGTPNQVWLNNGKGRFLAKPQRFTSFNSLAVALADFDGDGDLDALVANWGPYNEVWLNDGKGAFRDSGQRLFCRSSTGVAVGDLDGDGDQDAIVTNYGGIPSLTYQNDGKEHFAVKPLQQATSQAQGVAIGDLDNDGDLDFFIANQDDEPNQYGLNDGRGIFTPSSASLGKFNSNEVALGDLDGDGDLDAFVANNGQPNRVWLNQTVGGPVESRVQSDRAKITTKSVAALRFVLAPDRELTLVQDAVHRWSSPKLMTAEGAVFVWTVDKRPVVVAQVALMKDGVWLEEFQSLATGPLVGEQGGQRFWVSATEGIQWQSPPLSVRPGIQETERLKQMQEIAEQFHPRVMTTFGLEFLPEPLFRYADPTSGVLDGAMFSFTLDTDPEMLMLIEAQRKGRGAPVWKVAFAPMTSRPCDVLLGKTTFWTRPPLSPGSNSPFFRRSFRPKD